MKTFVLIVLFCLISALMADSPTYFFSHPNKVSFIQRRENAFWSYISIYCVIIQETWNIAKSKCEARGQKLAKIKTWIKRNDILDVVSIFVEDLTNRNNSIWTSGNALAVENIYVWEDNTRIQLANWMNDGPNNSEVDKRKDCVAMWNCCGSGLTFVVDTCDAEYYYLCESNVNN